MLRASDTAELFFNDVRVPASNRIGEENMGFIYQMEQFQEERMFVAARSMRSMERAIERPSTMPTRQVFGGTVTV